MSQSSHGTANSLSTSPASAVLPSALGTVYPVLFAISFAHLLNDTIQILLPAIYPLLKESYALSFTQLGLITFTYQVTASLLQPIVGVATDHRPMPYSLAFGMCLTGAGLVWLAVAGGFVAILMSAALIGLGSAIFHPESSRVAFMAAGRRFGFAQSLFQVGGNAGTAIGPLLAAAIILKRGQITLLWFFVVAVLGAILLQRLGRWQILHAERRPQRGSNDGASRMGVRTQPHKVVARALVILIALTFSKFVYLESIKSYYTFYLMDRFQLNSRHAVILLFIFLFAVAIGTIAGGPIGDKIGRKRVIWWSILGASPFALAMPYVSLPFTIILSLIIGVVIASAFPAILVYAQELMPGKVGLIAGIFFGFAFGIAGIGSAVLGKLADLYSIQFVYHLCAFLPLIGLAAIFLPNIEHEEEESITSQ